MPEYEEKQRQYEGEAGDKHDKAKQLVALIGGFLSAFYFFLLSIGVHFDWYNPDTINTFLAVLTSAVPLVLLLYGVYKNTYLLTERARKQEEKLKKEGMK